MENVQTQPLTYPERIALLRKKKIEHTLEKVRRSGYMDADDYGTVPLPEGWSFAPIPNHQDGGFYGLDGWSVNYAALMDAHPVYVDPLEALCGRWMTMLPGFRKPWPYDRFNYDDLRPLQELYGVNSGIGADSHFAGDYDIGMSLGFGGILRKIRDLRAQCGDDPQKRRFYDAHERVYEAIQRWIGRHIEEIQRQLETQTDPVLRQSLAQMLACNRVVISEPPANFQEACQWIAWFACASRIYDRDGAGCQLDMQLYPYYRRDIDAGVLDEERATFLLANLLLIETHYYQLSGCDDAGNDRTNALSWRILEAAHWLNASANLTVRVHERIDPAFFRQAVTYLFTDRNGWPRFSGHAGLMGYAKNLGSIDDSIANRRIAVGCNWMAVPGLEYSLNDCVKINVAKVFDVAYREMMDSGEAPGLDSLWVRFERHLAAAVDVTARGILFHLEHQHEVMPELVLNPLMADCMERAENITQCARIFTLGIDGVGIGTVADSFAALQQRIDLERRTTWAEVYAAVQADFEGCERLRLMLSTAQRYCGGRLGDEWARRVNEVWTRTVKAYPMPEGKALVPGWFSWSSTILFGKQLGATPNGRKAFTPVTHGANPTPGFRKDGAATAMANGIAAVQPGYGNPAPLQIELDPKLSAEEGGVQRVERLILGHIQQGGTLININVLDRDTLMAAHEDPMRYPDLVVRVTGFTAYFAALSPEFRQLVVDRFVEGA